MIDVRDACKGEAVLPFMRLKAVTGEHRTLAAGKRRA